MIKTGQIKFTKKAAKIAKAYFQKKKVQDFLIAIKRGQKKPSGYVGFYKQFLGEKQDQSSVYKVYTSDVEKSIKIFKSLLIKECGFDFLYYISKGCLLYLTKAERSKYEEMRLPETDWPFAVVDEENSGALIKFIGKIRLSTVDLANLLL